MATQKGQSGTFKKARDNKLKKKNNQKNPRKNHYILSYAAHTNLKIILASDIFHIYFNNSKRVLCIYQLPLKMKKGVFLRFEPLLNYTAKGTLRN